MTDLKSKYVEQYRDLLISKIELESNVPKNYLKEQPVIVDPMHLINALKSYLNGKISIYQLIEWVNIIWFSESYTLNEEHCDVMASVFDYLEEIDEKDYRLSESEIDKLISALENNAEI